MKLFELRINICTLNIFSLHVYSVKELMIKCHICCSQHFLLGCVEYRAFVYLNKSVEDL